jgi:CheY-like chemotaxis protein
MATVLLVEDDEAFAYAAAREIENAGHRVVAVTESMAGLNVLDTDPSIDLLVLDIKMPPGQPHGFALGRMANRRRPDLPIIYITAYPQLAEQDGETARVLRKPLEGRALVNEIAARLGEAAR